MFRIIKQRFSILVLFCISIILYNDICVADEIKIGVRANRGEAQAVKKWQPTVDYLNKKIPQHNFLLVPFEINSLLNQAVSRGDFHFVLTNPASYVEQNIRYDVTALATLINKRKGEPYTEFGSVIFTLANRNDISSFQDIKGKTFIGVDEEGFGGWRVAYKELLDKGIDPYEDFELLSFAGGIQQNVVYAIRDGKMDVGSVRTDMLERMAKRNEIKLETFKVLEPKKTPGFKFFHSSKLYPEWPFAKLAKTSDELAQEVAAVLFEITAGSAAAKSGKYVGWVKALDYTPVDNLLKDLRVGPYKSLNDIKASQVIATYWKEGLLALLAFVLAACTITYMVISNRRLKKMSIKLEEYHDHLEDKVAVRTAELSASNQELESYSYSIAHDLRSPLRSIVSFSQILKDDASTKLNDEELDIINRVVYSGKHMASVIDDILELSRVTRTTAEKELVNMSKICHKLVDALTEKNPERRVNWKIEEHLSVVGVNVLIHNLLQNLLENSYKFTRDATEPTIEVGKKLIDGVTVFFVRDNGVGFDMKYSEKIFSPFERLYRDEFDGTGVGLSIVQRVIQHHGGKVWVESSPNEGATFYFTFTSAPN